MDDVMIEFTPTPQDYERSMRAFLASRPILWLVTGWLGVPLLVLPLILLARHQFNISNFYAFVFSLVFGFTLLQYPFSIPAAAKKQAIKNQKLCAPVKYLFGDQKISALSIEYELKYKWSVYKNAFASKGFYFLVPEDRSGNFQFIPRYAFTDPGSEERFWGLLVHHLSTVRTIDTGLVGVKLWLLSGIISLIVNYSLLEMVGSAA